MMRASIRVVARTQIAHYFDNNIKPQDQKVYYQN